MRPDDRRNRHAEDTWRSTVAARCRWPQPVEPSTASSRVRSRILAGEGKLTIGSVDIGGRGAGAVAADLAVAGDTLRVEARAPSVKTTLDASIGLEDPNAFDGHANAGGVRHRGARRDDRTRRGRSGDRFAGASRARSLSTAICGIDVIDDRRRWTSRRSTPPVFDVPIAMNRGLRATVTGGHLQLENVAMHRRRSLGQRLGGTLATDRSSAAVVLDVDGDCQSAHALVEASQREPRPRRGRPNQRSSRDRTRHLPDSPRTGTVETTLSALSKGDRILAKDVRAAIVLTGQRARVRDATGSVLGGQLTATPTRRWIWLNQWLPSGSPDRIPSRRPRRPRSPVRRRSTSRRCSASSHARRSTRSTAASSSPRS